MELRDEDLAAALLELEQRMPRRDIAAALGVGVSELDEIASGYLPGPAVADRLRALSRDAGAGREIEPRRFSRAAIVVFLVVDAVFFALVAALVLLR